MNDDIAALATLASENGYNKIVGIGHGTGGIWWTTYANAAQNEDLRGIVYIEPTINMAEFMQDLIGPEGHDTLNWRGAKGG